MKVVREMDRKETKLVKNLNKCKTRKCNKYIQKYENETKLFEKKQNIACPQKSAKAFYKCSSKFYEGSTLQKISKKIVKCAEKKCYTQKKKLDKLRANQNLI